MAVRPLSPALDQPIPPTDPLWVLPIAGTEGWGDLWWQDGSPWLQALANAHCLPLRKQTHRGLRPFLWSTDLDGVNGWAALQNMIRQLLNRRHVAVVHRDWQAGGEACSWFLADFAYRKRNLIGHSHGGNVAIYCALDRSIRSLVTVGTPIRGDMQEVYEEARPNIGYHMHICDDTFDLWGTLGQLFDGDVRIDRTFPADWKAQPDLTLTLRGIGHGKILRDAKEITRWQTDGWLDLLRLGAHAQRFHPAYGGVDVEKGPASAR